MINAIMMTSIFILVSMNIYSDNKLDALERKLESAEYLLMKNTKRCK